MNVTLYTRKGCHLCDTAYETLVKYGLEPQTIDIDIDSDESLQAEFDTCVPVVVIDGKVRFRGHVEPALLKRLLCGES